LHQLSYRLGVTPCRCFFSIWMQSSQTPGHSEGRSSHPKDSLKYKEIRFTKRDGSFLHDEQVKKRGNSMLLTFLTLSGGCQKQRPELNGYERVNSIEQPRLHGNYRCQHTLVLKKVTKWEQTCLSWSFQVATGGICNSSSWQQHHINSVLGGSSAGLFRQLLRGVSRFASWYPCLSFWPTLVSGLLVWSVTVYIYILFSDYSCFIIVYLVFQSLQFLFISIRQNAWCSPAIVVKVCVPYRQLADIPYPHDRTYTYTVYFGVYIFTCLYIYTQN